MGQAANLQPSVWYRGLGRCWEAALDLWAVLVPMRFSVIVLIVGTILLLLVQQAQDALYVLAAGAANLNSTSIVRLIIFAVCTFIWAFNSFYAARFMSRLPLRGRAARIAELGAHQANPIHLYPPPLVQARWIADLNLHLPRWLGALVIVAVDASLLRASWRLSLAVRIGIIVAGAAMLVLYSYVVRYRREIVQALGRRTRKPQVFAISDSLEHDLGSVATLPRWCRRLVLATVLIILAVLIISTQTDLHLTHLHLWIALAALACLGVGLITLGQLRSIPYSTKWFVGVQVVVIGVLFLLSLVPQAAIVTNILGSPAVVVLAAAGWAFGGTLFLAYPAEITRLPILLGLIVLSVAFGILGNRDNHVIRETGRDAARSFVTDGPYACRRLSNVGPGANGEAHGAGTDAFAQAFDRWCNVAATRWGAKGRIPLVIVATAGGASRAAYWTEKVLAELEASVPGFHDYVFALSSVSGGTLGSAVYRLSLDLPHSIAQPRKLPFHGADCAAYDPGYDPAPCMLAMLQRDFLSSLLLGALYSDLVQRFLPGALLPDRASALERSWERTWASFFPQQRNWLADGFLTRMNAFLSTPDTWRPLMFFNGTSVVSGRRVITSNLPVDGHFSDSIDFFGWESQNPDVSRDIPVSTAVHNSARFPYLDAAGDVIVKGKIVDRIVDGGYFENYGAATALDVLEQLIDRGAVGSLDQIASDKPGERTIDPIIVQISNDASVPPRLPLGSDAPAPDKPLMAQFRVLADAFTPPAAFYDTRYGLGQRAIDVLRTRLAYLRDNGANDARYFHFQIADKNIPMSWLLSDYAGNLIDRQLPLYEQIRPCDPRNYDPDVRRSCNVDEFNRLVDLLREPSFSTHR